MADILILERRGYGLDARGLVEVKGKGRMETWWVRRRRAKGAGPLPAPAPPRSLAALVYTMLQARKRIYTHPLDAPNIQSSRGGSVRAPQSSRASKRHTHTNGQKMELGIRPHASSMVVRRPDMAPPIVGSVSAPHTPTAPHTSPERYPDPPPKLGIGARLKAASFSYKTRPPRERSPRIREEREGSVANGAPGSFRFRSVTTASFFRSRNREQKRSKEQVSEQPDESETAVTTKM